MKLLSRTDEVLLLSVCRLQAEAFGLSIREEVEEMTGKRFSVGGIYVPLDRLLAKGLLKVEAEKGSSERQGRPRRRFVITSSGLAALSEVRALNESMWSRLPQPILGKLQYSI